MGRTLQKNQKDTQLSGGRGTGGLKQNEQGDETSE